MKPDAHIIKTLFCVLLSGIFITHDTNAAATVKKDSTLVLDVVPTWQEAIALTSIFNGNLNFIILVNADDCAGENYTSQDVYRHTQGGSFILSPNSVQVCKDKIIGYQGLGDPSEFKKSLDAASFYYGKPYKSLRSFTISKTYALPNNYERAKVMTKIYQLAKQRSDERELATSSQSAAIIANAEATGKRRRPSSSGAIRPIFGLTLGNVYGLEDYKTVANERLSCASGEPISVTSGSDENGDYYKFQCTVFGIPVGVGHRLIFWHDESKLTQIVEKMGVLPSQTCNDIEYIAGVDYLSRFLPGSNSTWVKILDTTYGNVYKQRLKVYQDGAIFLRIYEADLQEYTRVSCAVPMYSVYDVGRAYSLTPPRNATQQ